ncbi:MAG: aldehyde dehydrogenase family protein, partial [Pedobacter sp.]
NRSNVEKAAKKLAWGKLVNAGQTCIAPDYILVQEDVHDAFVLHFKEQVKRLFYNGENKTDSASYGRMINEHHFKRINSLIEGAVKDGAKIEMGGNADLKSLTIEPTMLTSVDLSSKIMDEEIFGPVLPVISYSKIADAIRFINEKDKPLALYIFDNSNETKQILQQTSSGGVCVNDVLIHISNPNLPFGGVNSSGIGSGHGFYGFKSFSHERAVVFQSKIDFTSMVYPPYEKKNWVLRLLKRII